MNNNSGDPIIYTESKILLGVFARERRRVHQGFDNTESPDQFGIATHF